MSNPKIISDLCQEKEVEGCPPSNTSEVIVNCSELNMVG